MLENEFLSVFWSLILQMCAETLYAACVSEYTYLFNSSCVENIHSLSLVDVDVASRT